MTQSIESIIEVLQAYKDGKRVVDINGLEPSDFHLLLRWLGHGLTITITAPEPKKKVKLEAWFGENKRLIWVEKGFYEKSPPFWTRVPSEDKEILL